MSLAEIVLRDYRETDLEAIYRLDEDCFAAAFRFDRKSMREFAEARNAICLIAERSGGGLRDNYLGEEASHLIFSFGKYQIRDLIFIFINKISRDISSFHALLSDLSDSLSTCHRLHHFRCRRRLSHLGVSSIRILSFY